MAGDDFAINAGWGYHGPRRAVMPGQGRAVERSYTPEERGAMSVARPALGDTTFDVYLNGEAFWRNIPAGVWNYSRPLAGDPIQRSDEDRVCGTEVARLAAPDCATEGSVPPPISTIC